MDISASIIQGSAVGPVSYVIIASDLTIVTTGNSMHKYADDTYIVIPARNAQSREVELDHVTAWAQSRRKSQAQYPPTLPDIHRVTQIKILGVTVSDHLSTSEHVRAVICNRGQSLYAIKVLRTHGMCVDALKDTYRAG